MSTSSPYVYDVTEQTSERRTYFTSAPVCVTVHNDGTVTYSLDLSEVGADLRDDDTIQFEETIPVSGTEGVTVRHYATNETVDADAVRIDAALAAGAITQEA